MEPTLVEFERLAQLMTQIVALVIDLIAVLVIASAALRAIGIYLFRTFRRSSPVTLEQIRLSLGRSLVLALEFLIGADILRTAIAPSWTGIGQLGAIILLRTLLDFFLERELKDISASASHD